MRIFIAFTLGAIIYSIIEIIWRGHTHWTMTLTSGTCLVVIYLINNTVDAPIGIKCIIGAFFITIIEFVVGNIINIKLKYNV